MYSHSCYSVTGALVLLIRENCMIKIGPDQKKFDPSFKDTPKVGGCQAAAEIG